jgi:hypothetical protein
MWTPRRDDILAAAVEITTRSGQNELTPAQLLAFMREIRHFSGCCANAPANHQTRYDDFERIGHGRYRISRHPGGL